MTNLLDAVVERTPLSAPDGKSESLIESARLADGRTVVIKHVSAEKNWLMRATDDTGRIYRLWQSGFVERIPRLIEHALLDVQVDGTGWIIVMKDVSEAMLPEQGMVSRFDSRRFLEAAAAMHEEFRGSWLDALCEFERRYSFLSAATARRERDGDAEVPKLIGTGWEMFAEMVPASVADAVIAISEQPELLARKFPKDEFTLIHGDLKFGNLGLLPDRITLVDWGDGTGYAPPAVEFAWYLAINGNRIDATREQVIEDFGSCYSEPVDPQTLELALLGALVQLGWNKALGAAQDDPAARAVEQADLEWWIRRARAVLEEWSPI